MNIINEDELQILKKIIISQDIMNNKLKNYADYAVDPQIKQIFNQAAKDAQESKEKLISFLKNEK